MDFLSQQDELQHRRKVAMKFPENDEQGNKFFRTYEFTLTGTQYKHDGNIPENFLNDSMIGDEVRLLWDKKNRYDDKAIKVLWKERYIGWLPGHAGQQKEVIIRRLERNQTVLARIKDVHSIKIKEKTGEKDEDGYEIWADAWSKTADVIVAVYNLPKEDSSKVCTSGQFKGRNHSKAEPEITSHSQNLDEYADNLAKSIDNHKSENNPKNVALGCLILIFIGIACFALSGFVIDKLFGFLGL